VVGLALFVVVGVALSVAAGIAFAVGVLVGAIGREFPEATEESCGGVIAKTAPSPLIVPLITSSALFMTSLSPFFLRTD
jgi:hypothetical protein